MTKLIRETLLRVLIVRSVTWLATTGLKHAIRAVSTITCHGNSIELHSKWLLWADTLDVSVPHDLFVETMKMVADHKGEPAFDMTAHVFAMPMKPAGTSKPSAPEHPESTEGSNKNGG